MGTAFKIVGGLLISLAVTFILKWFGWELLVVIILFTIGSDMLKAGIEINKK